MLKKLAAIAALTLVFHWMHLTGGDPDVHASAHPVGFTVSSIGSLLQQLR
jgi:hypothetical protein